MALPSDDRTEPLLRPAALLFDMDGTLTQPMLDFPAIKAEMRIGVRPILEALAEMSPAERAAAEAILLRHEQRAATESTLNPGCVELLAWAREHRLPTALITRNSRASAAIVLSRHDLTFDVLITRETCRFKPHPEPLHTACRHLAVRESDAWMIGDGIHDIQAGAAANIPTIWLSHGRPQSSELTPWRTVTDLWELLRLLQSSRNRS